MQFKNLNTRLPAIAVVAWLCCALAQGDAPQIDRINDPSGGYDALQDVLQYASVRESFDLRPEQHAALQRLNSENKVATQHATATWRALPSADRTADRLQRELRTVRSMVLPGIEQALDASQFQRLQQLQLQLRIRRSLFSPLYANDVTSELQLTSDGLRKWKETIDNQQRSYREKISELHANVPELLMRELTAEQRRKYQETFGNRYADPSTLPKIDDDRVPGRGFPPMLNLARYPGIRHELEIVDEQREQISMLLSDYRRRERSLTLQWRARDVRRNRPPSNDDKGKQEELRRKEAEEVLRKKELQALQKNTRSTLDEMLLPPQIERLQQLVLQARAQSQSNFWILTDVAAKVIEISPEQQLKLRQVFETESVKIGVQSTRLYEETLERILATLTGEQRVRYSLLVGVPFKLDSGN
ncbi:MAG: hypothetical protein H8E66_30400 [Planctomycetes bacterium]|nr:hypothetical protein [Planctomycetota bacterium]